MEPFDPSRPNVARVWDYWLGGKDNFAADRELGDRTLQAYPNMVFSVRANRAFLARSVRFLTAEAGITVFRVAFERWVDRANRQDLQPLIHESLEELRAVTAA